MRLRRALTGTLAALALALTSAGVATAETSIPSLDSDEPILTTVYGGTTQSTDPTRMDYVPSADSPHNSVVQPRNADGYQAIGGFTITVGGVPIPIPKTLLHHSIRGTGYGIQTEWANFASGSKICNYQVAFQNRRGSTIYSTSYTGTYKTCAISSGRIYNNTTPRTAKNGLQCARLFSNGYYVGEQCHSMTP